MIRSNEHYAGLPGAYLFATVAARVRAHREQHPALPVISLGIGDVTRPLPPAVITALHSAVDEMASSASFKGYGPEQGYDFLREAIAAHDYRAHGVQMDAADIFISDGSKCDVANIQELFSLSCRVAVTDPVYPVYVDSNAMAGRAGRWTGERWSDLIYLPCTEANGFVPDFPDAVPDIIYLCYPNNPTGTVLHRDALAAWVDYARRHGALIIYDAAYEAFIKDTDSEVPHSIFEIPGAEEVAVECRSFSKTADSRACAALTTIPAAVTIPGPTVPASVCRTCGSAARAPSTTAVPTSCSVPPRPSTAQRGRNRSAPPSRPTWPMRPVSIPASRAWAFPATAASMPPISG